MSIVISSIKNFFNTYTQCTDNKILTESEKTCLIYTKYTCMHYIMYLLFWVSYNNSISFSRPFRDWYTSGKNFKWTLYVFREVIKFQTQKMWSKSKTGFLRPSHINYLLLLIKLIASYVAIYYNVYCMYIATACCVVASYIAMYLSSFLCTYIFSSWGSFYYSRHKVLWS